MDDWCGKSFRVRQRRRSWGTSSGRGHNNQMCVPLHLAPEPCVGARKVAPIHIVVEGHQFAAICHHPQTCEIRKQVFLLRIPLRTWKCQSVNDVMVPQASCPGDNSCLAVLCGQRIRSTYDFIVAQAVLLVRLQPAPDVQCGLGGSRDIIIRSSFHFKEALTNSRKTNTTQRRPACKQ